MANKGKIFIVYHINEKPIQSDIYQPIAVGPKKDNFSNDFLKDDVGENIADKNQYYNELTAIYWVYKHIDEFKDYEYIGFEHYRRLFCFNHLDQSVYVKKNLKEDYISIDNSKLERIFNDFDLIVPYPNRYKSVKRHYEKAHNDVDVDIILDIIKKDYPKLYKVADEYFINQYEYSYNMFVFKKDDFVKYSSFIFDVLEKFINIKKEIDRLYISERLTGIYINYLISSGFRPLKLPVLHIRKKSFKKSIDQVDDNFKKGKDNGFIYKCKSLWLFLMPRWFEQLLRRNKTK